MSNKIDERITRIRFDNDQFERGVATSMQSLDRLKNKLESTESIEAFTGIQRAADKTDFSGLEKAITSVGDKFSYLRMIAINVLSDIANRAISTGVSLVKNLSTDNIAAGWEKYDQEVQAVQTIMVTLDDTTIEEVEDHLKKVGWYADETSYSYNEMVSAMSKLISSGVNLEDATNAVLGISNAAAAAGVSTKKAQQAFYNFSQAFGAGYMQLLDWRSIELLNMGTPEFKRNIIRTAVELGKIVDLGNDMYVAADKYGQKNWQNSIFGVNNMRESLSDKWFDKDVMNKVLGSYTNFTNKVYELQMAEESEYDTASEVIAALKEQGENLQEYSAKAFIAGQEAKTFAEAIDSVKDAVSTKWKDTFKALFGNYAEAKVLWTDLANDLYDLFAASGDVRNEILAQWNDPTFLLPPDERLRELYKFPEFQAGRDMLVKGLYNLFESVVNLVNMIKDAWREVFPAMNAVKLLRITRKFLAFTEEIKASTENMEGFRGFLVSIFQVLKKATDLITRFTKSLKTLWPVVKKVGSIARVVGKQIWQFFKDAYEYLNIDQKLENGANRLKKIFETVKQTILDFDENSIHLPTFQDFLKAIDKVKEATAGFRQKISDIFSWIREKFNQFMPTMAIDNISLSMINLESITNWFSTRIKPTLENIKNFFVNTWASISGIFASIQGGAKNIAEWLKNTFGNVKLKDILGTTILGVMTWFEFRLALTIGRIGKTIDALSDVMWAFSKVLLSKAFEIRIKALRNFALSILAVAAALYIVSKIDNAKLTQAAVTVGFITLVLAGIATMMIKLQSKLKGPGLGFSYKKGEGLKLSGTGSKTGLIGLVIGVLGMVWAVKLIYDMISDGKMSMENIHEISKRVETIAGVLAVCVGAMQIMTGWGTKIAGGKNRISALAPVMLASAMLIMIRVFEKIDQMEIEHVGKLILGMIGIMGSIGLLSLMVGRVSAGTGFGMLSIVAAVWLAVIGIQKLETLNIDLSEQGPAILLVGGLILFLAWVQRFSTAGMILKKGERFKKAQTNFISIVIGLIACVGAVYALSKLNTKELFNGMGATITLLGILFGGLYFLMGQISKIQTGVKTFGTFAGMSILVAVIGALLSVVTIAMHFGSGEVWQAVGVISVLFVMLSGVLAAAHKMPDVGKTMGGLAGVIGALVLMLLEFFILATIDLKRLTISVGLLAGLMLVTAVTIRIISGIRTDFLADAASILVFLSGFMGLLLAIVWGMSEFVKNTDGLIKTAGAMAIVGITVTAVFAAVSFIGKAGKGAINAALYGSAAMAIVIGALVGIVALLTALFGWITNGFRDVDQLKYYLNEMVEVSFLIGAVVNALIAGLFVGGARLVADELSEFAKRLVPFAKAISDFPSDFAKKVGEFGKAILALSWYGFWSSALRGLGEKGTLKRLAVALKEAAGPIKDASIEFADINVDGLNKAVESIAAIGNLTSSLSIFDPFGIIMRFKSAMISGAIKSFVKVLENIKEDHITKAGYLSEIFKVLAEMPTRERANILSDQKSLLGMSITLWTSTIFLRGIIKRLGQLDNVDLGSAKDNTEKIVEIFKTISSFTQNLDKNLGAIQRFTGSRETTLFEYYIFMGVLGGLFGKGLVWKNLSDLDTNELVVAAGNVRAIMEVFKTIHAFASQLDEGGGIAQTFSGTATNTLNAYAKVVERLPGIAEAIVNYGRIMMDPYNVGAVNAATNVTNSVADAFHNLADQVLVERLKAISQAILELGHSTIEEIPYYFSDEFTTERVGQAVDNLVMQFRDVLFAELQKNRIGGFIGGVLHFALITLQSFDQLYYSRGQSIADAFINGVKSKFGSAKTSGIQLANQFVDGIESKDGLDENSPSKVLFERGVYGSEGFRLGILSMYDQVELAGESVGDGAGLGFGIGFANSIKKIGIGSTLQRSFSTDSLIKKGGFLDGVIGFLGGRLVNEETGEEATIEDAVQSALNPVNGVVEEIKKLVPEMEDIFDAPWLQGTMTEITKATDDLKKIFSPSGVPASAESIEKSMEITEGVLSQLQGIPSDFHEVLQKSSSSYNILEDLLFGGESAEDYVNELMGEVRSSYEGIINDLTGMNGDWSMSNYLDSLKSELGSYEYPVTPVLTDENGNRMSYGDWQDMLGGSGSGSLGKTVAGYTSEDVRNLTLEIYHLEDALYSLKEAMKDQQVTHSGELTIHYSNESDFVDRIQTAIIGEIRREVRG